MVYYIYDRWSIFIFQFYILFSNVILIAMGKAEENKKKKFILIKKKKILIKKKIRKKIQIKIRKKLH